MLFVKMDFGIINFYGINYHEDNFASCYRVICSNFLPFNTRVFIFLWKFNHWTPDGPLTKFGENWIRFSFGKHFFFVATELCYSWKWTLELSIFMELITTKTILPPVIVLFVQIFCLLIQGCSFSFENLIIGPLMDPLQNLVKIEYDFHSEKHFLDITNCFLCC